MNKKNRKPTQNDSYVEDSIIDIAPVVSAGEMTGSIPSAITNEGQLGSYAALLPFQRKKRDTRRE